MKSFESIVEDVYSGGQTINEAIKSITEEPKVDFWRTTDGGHKIGFQGKPGGKATPVAGNPHVVGKKKGSKTSKKTGGKKGGGSKETNAKKARLQGRIKSAQAEIKDMQKELRKLNSLKTLSAANRKQMNSLRNMIDAEREDIKQMRKQVKSM